MSRKIVVLAMGLVLGFGGTAAAHRSGLRPAFRRGKDDQLRPLLDEIADGEPHLLDDTVSGCRHGVLHDRLDYLGRILDITDAAHRASSPGWSVHAAGIEFYYAFLIRQSTKADTVIVGIVFRTFHHLQGRVEGVTAIL